MNGKKKVEDFKYGKYQSFNLIQRIVLYYSQYCLTVAVADPGFERGRGKCILQISAWICWVHISKEKKNKTKIPAGGWRGLNYTQWTPWIRHCVVLYFHSYHLLAVSIFWDHVWHTWYIDKTADVVLVSGWPIEIARWRRLKKVGNSIKKTLNFHLLLSLINRWL